MIENRLFNIQDAELRAYSEDSKMIISGYAAKHNIESRLLAEGGKIFTEILLPGAFREVLNDDVFLTFNHDKNKVFARTVNKTLTLEEDNIGLKFRAELNETSGSIDLYKMVERGDIFSNSFAFTVDNEGQQWSRSSNGDPIRKISRISKLYDISAVTHAAYPETELSVVRGLNGFLEDVKPLNISQYLNELELLNIKLKIK